MNKITLVMSSTNSSGQKAVLNVEQSAKETCGSVRLFNFSREPEGILSLGFATNGTVVKCGLMKGSDMKYNFKTEEQIDLNHMSCAVVQFTLGSSMPILFGGVNGAKISATELKLASTLGVLDQPISAENTKKVLDENQIFLEDQDLIDKQIDKEIECSVNCNKCKYREAFFQSEEDAPKQNEPMFFEQIKDSLSSLMEKFPEENFLADIIPNSKWVKVDYENNGEYYVVGVIYQEGAVKYVCYGVPGYYSKDAPEELRGFSKWLPLDANKPTEFGYWLTTQDAENGDNVELDII
ncbi:MAG: hypothetical protein RR140_04080 [Clostridia bacterium]